MSAPRLAPHPRPRSAGSGPPVAALVAGLALLLPACLDPLASDVPPFEGLVHPAGWEATYIEDDPEMADRVRRFDTGTIPRLSGFAAGERVWFWRFPGNGDVGFAAPLYKLYDCTNDQPIDAPDIIDVVPGDPAYTPLWRVHYVCVSSLYAGEVIASRQGIDDAIRARLVVEVRPTELVVNCPVVRRGARLAVGPEMPGGTPLFESPVRGYYRERETYWFGFVDQAMTLEDGLVPSSPVYVVQRIDQAEPLDEISLDRDLTGDGDTNDTNLIFSRGREDAMLGALWRPVRTRVAADVAAIDTHQDETMSDLRSASNLVDREGAPVSGVVVRMDEPADDAWFIANLQRHAGSSGGY